MAPTFDEAAVAARVRDAVARVQASTDLDELEALDVELAGRRSVLAGWHKELGSLDPERRRALGQVLHEATQEVASALAARRSELVAEANAARIAADRLLLDELEDLVVEATMVRGHRHLVTKTRDELEDVFVAMGFTVAEGPEIETDWYNFEALNLPPGHPARTMHDTFYVDASPEESVVLRTHTSPVQVRLMEAAVRDGSLPLHVVVPGRVFRRDTPDASHLVEFHQIEGLVVDEGITFADLAGGWVMTSFGIDGAARGMLAGAALLIIGVHAMKTGVEFVWSM